MNYAEEVVEVEDMHNLPARELKLYLERASWDGSWPVPCEIRLGSDETVVILVRPEFRLSCFWRHRDYTTFTLGYLPNGQPGGWFVHKSGEENYILHETPSEAISTLKAAVKAVYQA